MIAVSVILFDWGDTLMRDYSCYEGPMAYWPEVSVMPGTYRLLSAISGKYRLGIASGARESDAVLLAKALQRVDIAKHFDFIFTPSEIGVNKTDTAFFSRIISRIAVQPDDVLVIGNDYERDIIPAKKTGIKTVYVAPGKTIADMKSADYVITELEELVKYLTF